MVGDNANHEWRIKNLEDRAAERDKDWRKLMEEVIPGINTKIALNNLKVSLITALATGILTAVAQRVLP